MNIEDITWSPNKEIVNTIVLIEDKHYLSLYYKKYDNKTTKLYGLTQEKFLIHREYIDDIDYLDKYPYAQVEDLDYHINENRYKNRFIRDYGILMSKKNSLLFFDLTNNNKCCVCQKETNVDLGKQRLKNMIKEIKDYKIVSELNMHGFQVQINNIKIQTITKYSKLQHICDSCYRDIMNNFKHEISYILDDIKAKQFKKDNNNRREIIPAKVRIKLLNSSARWDEGEQKHIPSCQFCGTTSKERALHIDHIIPLSKGGTNDIDNLQVLCDLCNLQKNNKYELIINNNN